MAKPRVGTMRAGQMMGGSAGWHMPLEQILRAAFNPGRPDGLRALSTNNRSTPYGPNPGGLSGVDLMKYWSSLDQNTWDKRTPTLMHQWAMGAPGSQFASHYYGVFGGPQAVGGPGIINGAMRQIAFNNSVRDGGGDY